MYANHESEEISQKRPWMILCMDAITSFQNFPMFIVGVAGLQRLYARTFCKGMWTRYPQEFPVRIFLNHATTPWWFHDEFHKISFKTQDARTSSPHLWIRMVPPYRVNCPWMFRLYAAYRTRFLSAPTFQIPIEAFSKFVYFQTVAVPVACFGKISIAGNSARKFATTSWYLDMFPVFVAFQVIQLMSVRRKWTHPWL